MSELPEGWTDARIGDTCDVRSGVGFPLHLQGRLTGKYPVFKVGDISQSVLHKDGVLIEAAHYINDEDLKEMKGATFSVGSTVFAKIGEAVRLNRRAFVARICVADNNVMGVKCFEGCDKFFYHFLKTIDLEEAARSTTVPSIRKSDIEDLRIPLAPLAEQKVIADKLDALLAQVDTLKARLDAIPAILKRFRQSVLSAAVTGKLTEDWRQKHQRESLSLTEFINNAIDERMKLFNQEAQRAKREQRKIQYGKPSFELFESSYDLGVEAPPGWFLAHMGDICTVVRGASPRPASDPKYFGGNTPWITVAEITKDDGVYLYETEKGLSPEGRECSRYVEAGTLMLTNSGATLGVPKILGIGGCFNDGSVALLDHVLTDKHYLYFFLRSQTKAMRMINQGAAQPNLNTEIVRCLEVPIPPLPEQTEIVRRVESLLAFADQIEARAQEAIARVKHLTQSILAKAFRGELTEEWRKAHPELVSGENSAEALLERIRATRASDGPTASRGRRSRANASTPASANTPHVSAAEAPKRRGRPRKA